MTRCTFFCPVALLSIVLKRLLDILFAGGLVVVLSPVFAAVGLAVLADLGTPVLFRQSRLGKDDEPFILLKFRSMHDGQTTAFGRFIRRWSLDELPQLVNVLRGDMSLVGPRPLYAEYLPFYTELERKRHSVRPGITGWAQINGRNLVDWDQKLALDVWYVEHRSLLLDMRILAETVWVVISGRGMVANPDEMGLRDLTSVRQTTPNPDRGG